MGGEERLCLRWDNFQSHMQTSFETHRVDAAFVDVTLVSAGKTLHAHKMVLSACSPVFNNMLKENPCKHPIIVLHNVLYADLLSLISFMYRGEVDIQQSQLHTFLTVADSLQISGLADCKYQQNSDSTKFKNSEDNQRIFDEKPQDNYKDKSTTATRRQGKSSHSSQKTDPPNKRGRHSPPTEKTVSNPKLKYEPELEPGLDELPESVPICDIFCTKSDVVNDVIHSEDSESGGRGLMQAITSERSLQHCEDGGLGPVTTSSGETSFSVMLRPDSLVRPGEFEDAMPPEIIEIKDEPEIEANEEPEFEADPYSDGLMYEGQYDESYQEVEADDMAEESYQDMEAGDMVEGEPFRCSLCGHRYRLASSLTAHMAMHDGGTTCNLCGKVLSRRSDMRRHMRTVHRDNY